MYPYRNLTASLLVGLPLVAGCGGGAGGAESPTDKKFDALSKDEKMEFMASTVMPAMSSIFQGFKSDKYAEFQCATCHGEDFAAVDYKMPNSLYGLPAADPIKDGMDYDAEMTTFMQEKVVPKMGELLGEKVDCFSCHPKEG